MGGRGSGRRAWPQPPLCHESMTIDLAWLRRKKLLRPGTWSTLNWTRGDEPTGSIQITTVSNGIRLNYRTRVREGDWRQVDEHVPFVWTKTRFDGRRTWFQCLGCR